MKVAVFGKQFNKPFAKYAKLFFEILAGNKVDVIIYKPFYDFLLKEAKVKPEISGSFNKGDKLAEDTDYVFSIGGDGTFLEAISYVVRTDIPIIGINSGRMGFLANIAKDEIENALDSLFRKEYDYESRTMIQLETENNLFGDQNYALNELTIFKKDTASMITVHTYLNNTFLNSYWADGLIISTPTGSTAYSLSVGGPIVVPNSNNFIISPIAPHNLTVRPIVISDMNEITLKVEGRSQQFIASLDHRSVIFDKGAELLIKKAGYQIKLIKLKNTSYFNTLRNKLMWGFDKRN